MSPSRRSSHRAGGVVGWVAGILAVAALVFVLWLIFAPDATAPEEPIGGETPPAQEDARGGPDDATAGQDEPADQDETADAEIQNGAADSGEGDAVSQVQQEIQSADDANVDVQAEPETPEARDEEEDTGLQNDEPSADGDSTAASDEPVRTWDGADRMQSSTSDLTERIRGLEQQVVQNLETPGRTDGGANEDGTP